MKALPQLTWPVGNKQIEFATKSSHSILARTSPQIVQAGQLIDDYAGYTYGGIFCKLVGLRVSFTYVKSVGQILTAELLHSVSKMHHSLPLKLCVDINSKCIQQPCRSFGWNFIDGHVCFHKLCVGL